MNIILSSSITNKYPDVSIGYIVADVNIEPSHPYVDALKAELDKYLASNNITADNFKTHMHISEWQRIYRNDFNVKPSEFRSSVEALLRRIIQKKGIWTVSSIVDLYNCCSLKSLLPMGAYDLQKIKGDIHLRHGQTGDNFIPLGSQETVPVSEKHVVYADEEKILCWLWNHKDSQLSSITSDTKQAIFFVDAAFRPQIHSVEDSIDLLSYHLGQIGCNKLASGILNADKPIATI